MNATVLITGLEGFTGQYLGRSLASHGYDVYGTVQQASGENSNIIQCDLNDCERLTAWIKKIRPDYIVNLAGIALASHNSAIALFQANLLGVLSLLEAVQASGHVPKKILLASSAHVYGNQTSSPISESCALQPTSEYGISKLAMEQTAQLWFNRLPIVIVRPFNYTGLGQSTSFLPSKLVNHFANRSAEIELGNLHVARDWSDVRDVVNFYRLLLESKAESLIVNICTGQSHSLQYVIDVLSNLSGHRPEISVNPAFVRANEIKELRGDNRLLKSIIGDFQLYSLEETLGWMLNESTVSI